MTHLRRPRFTVANRGYFSGPEITACDAYPDAIRIARQHLGNSGDLPACGKLPLALYAGRQAEAPNQSVMQELFDLAQSNETRDVRARVLECGLALGQNRHDAHQRLLPRGVGQRGILTRYL